MHLGGRCENYFVMFCLLAREALFHFLGAIGHASLASYVIYAAFANR